MDFKHKISGWIIVAKQHIEDQIESKSDESSFSFPQAWKKNMTVTEEPKIYRSYRSKASSSQYKSSLSSAIAKKMTKLAELKVKENILEKQQALQHEI